MEATITGYCSSSAITQVVELVYPILPTIFLALKRVDENVETLSSQVSLVTIREALAAVFGAQVNSDSTLLKQLALALEYLRAAGDKQNRAVAYLLTFAAIESLICYKDFGFGETKQLKDWVPTLLQPVPSKRKNHRNAVEELYKIRCCIAHGSQFSTSAEQLDSASNLASALLVGVCHWIDYCRQNKHLGAKFELNKEDKRRFVNFLNSSRNDGEVVCGIPDLSALLPTD